MNAEHDVRFSNWIGRTQVEEDVADAASIRGLAALLDHDCAPWREGFVPPLAHWLFFPPLARQSKMGEDGHPLKGDFLPPIDLPRRMWAGSRVRFAEDIPLGAHIRRATRIANVQEKRGRSGRMIFVTLEHQILAGAQVTIVEEQDIVYREALAPDGLSAVSVAVTEEVGAKRAEFRPDTVRMFRFAALTFNAHRIHYDSDYTVNVERYPGLVVQGPFVAILLLDHYLRLHPRASVGAFRFRAESPLFDNSGFMLNCDDTATGARLWAQAAAKPVSLRAEVELRA